jgi:hypothetical protein
MTTARPLPGTTVELAAAVRTARTRPVGTLV